MMRFELNEKEWKAAQTWLQEVAFPSLLAYQRANIKKPDVLQQSYWDEGMPCGVKVEYQFHPTATGIDKSVTASVRGVSMQAGITDWDSQ